MKRSTVTILLLFIVPGCHRGTPFPEDAIENVCKEFNLRDVSYMVTEDGRVTAARYSDNPFPGIQRISEKITSTFADPIQLDLLINDSSIHEKEKDLVIVPTDSPYPEDSVSALVHSAIGSARNKNADTDFSGFTRPPRKGIKSLFTRLSGISHYFDTRYIQYAPLHNKLISNIFPTWYTENKKLFFGWKIIKFQKQTILWNCFTVDDQTILLLKFMDRDIFAALSYTSKNIPGPYDYNKSDLLLSPIAIALLQPAVTQIDFKMPWKAIADSLTLLRGQPNRYLYIKDLIAHARYYERIGDTAAAGKLYRGYAWLTPNSLLGQYLNEPVVAETGYISDNLNESVPFTVDSGGYYQIFAGGQVLAVSDYNYSPYQYDNIQLFFNKHIQNGSAGRDETQVFHFNYRFNKIAGVRDESYPDSWIKDTHIRYAFTDPSDTAYILEIAIPWNEIHCPKPPKGKRIAMNIFIGDSDLDEDRRESILSWSIKEGEGWDDPSKFGILSFYRGGAYPGRAGYRSQKVDHPPVIDGLTEKIWDKVPYSDINIAYQNKVSRFDNSARFKTVYDDTCLYFLFYVVDNCKNKTGIITKDKCWIENAANGEVIWKLPADTTPFLPSYSVEHKTYLKAGKYRLRYVSDGGHSFEGWFGPSPQNDIYGGVIYKAKPNSFYAY